MRCVIAHGGGSSSLLTANIWKNLVRSAKTLQGNAKVCVLCEPIWNIPMTMALAFQSLYFRALGCTAEQVGILTSVSMLSQFVCALVSGYITDRLGRRFTMAFFDTIGWVVSLAIYAVSHSFWALMAAAVVNGAFRISTTAWSCLFVEDTLPQNRAFAFTWLQAASIVAGFFAPLGGMLVTAWGIEPAERVLLWCAAGGMALMTIVRTWNLKETEISRLMRQASQEQSLGMVMQGYLRSLRRLRAEGSLLGTLVVRALLFSIVNLRITYLPMTLTEGLGLPSATVATLQTVMSVIMLVILLFVLPSMQNRDARKPLLASFVAVLASFGILLVLPQLQLWPVLADGVLLAMAIILAEPLSATAFANSVSESERALMNSVMALLSLIVSAAFQYLGGLSARLDPRLPMALIAVLAAVCAAIQLGMLRDKPPVNGRPTASSSI